MTEEAAFLAAIIAEPDDDTPRLVFADWLDENGDPDRAAFIRHQIRGDALPAHLLDAGPDPRWHPVIAGFTRNKTPTSVIYRTSSAFGPTTELFYSRGFVYRVECSIRQWLQHGPALVRRNPVTWVDLADRRPERTVAGRYGWTHTHSFFPATTLPRDWDSRSSLIAYEHTWIEFSRVDNASAYASERAIAWAKATTPKEWP